MNSLRSSAPLRSIICDTSNELAAINSTTLPDGATVYNNETQDLYRLDKSAGTTFDALIGGGAVIKPDDNTDARWLAETVLGASPYYYSAYLNGVAQVAITGNTWALLGNVAAAFLRSTGSALAFTLNATTGLITYNGPPVLALVRASATVANRDGATLLSLSAVISKNDDVPAGSSATHDALGAVGLDIASGGQTAFSTERIVLLNPGTTLQLALLNSTNTDDLTVGFYQFVVIPL